MTKSTLNKIQSAFFAYYFYFKSDNLLLERLLIFVISFNKYRLANMAKNANIAPPIPIYGISTKVIIKLPSVEPIAIPILNDTGFNAEASDKALGFSNFAVRKKCN